MGRHSDGLHDWKERDGVQVAVAGREGLLAREANGGAGNHVFGREDAGSQGVVRWPGPCCCPPRALHGYAPFSVVHAFHGSTVMFPMPAFFRATKNSYLSKQPKVPTGQSNEKCLFVKATTYFYLSKQPKFPICPSNQKIFGESRILSFGEKGGKTFSYLGREHVPALAHARHHSVRRFRRLGEGGDMAPDFVLAFSPHHASGLQRLIS